MRARPLMLLSLVLALLLVAPAPGRAMPVGGGAAAGAPPVGEVTLITGDRVLLAEGEGGRPVGTVVPAEREGNWPGFTSWVDGDELHVVPNDVAHLVPEVLDPALFDVTELVRMGYGDRRAASLPLMVEHAPGLRAAAALPGLRPERALPSIGATAASLPKEQADELGARLAAMRPGAGVAAAGQLHVWLDRRLEATELDWNLRHIDAPGAWETGATGEGVRVAVIDTGIDATHPDLQGQVVAAEDFTGSPSPADDNGHGTHVASIIAGTGAAADGARRGVAFEADLLNGKVLDSSGFGRESWAIAAFEWAVAQGADVVNMSFGGQPREEGPEPLCEAIDRLAAGGDTLFVAAAGNFGGEFTIQSPGVCRNALTVGAVTETGFLWFFSSSGPTADYRVKPELTAPGDGIVAARAGGGTSDTYTTFSGTSQATPHVTGAAALLLQARPELTRAQVRSALVGSAEHQHDVITPFHEGAGRLDAAAALGQRLHTSTATVDFGYQRFPVAGPDTRRLELSNSGDTAQTVDLTLDLPRLFEPGEAQGPVTMSPTHLEVPPRGTASAELTFDPSAGEPGLYGGILAVTPVGATAPALRVPVGLYYEPERYDVTVRVLDRHGNRYAGGSFEFMNLETFTEGFNPFVPLDASGEETLRVAPGWYSLTSRVVTPAGGGEPETITIAADPEVHITSDTTVVLDARAGKPVGAGVRGLATEPVGVSLSYSIGDEEGRRLIHSVDPDPAAVTAGRVFVTPSGTVSHGDFAYTSRWRLLADGRRHDPDLLDLVFELPRLPGSPRHQLDRGDLRRLARIDASYHALGNQPGDYLEFRAFWTDKTLLSTAFPGSVRLPSRRLELVTPGADIHWQQCVVMTSLDLCETEAKTYRPRDRVRVPWGDELHSFPAILRRRVDVLWVQAELSDGTHHGRPFFGVPRQEHIRVFRNGELLGERDDSFGFFPAPADPATFTVEQTLTVDPGILPVASTSRVRWTFHSEPPTGPVFAVVPPALIIDLGPHVDLRNQAPAFRPLPVDLTVHRRNDLDTPVRDLTELRLEVSTDGGTTWRHLVAFPHRQGGYRAWVPAHLLRPGASVSLRATAADDAGSRTEQTVLPMLTVRGS